MFIAIGVFCLLFNPHICTHGTPKAQTSLRGAKRRSNDVCAVYMRVSRATPARAVPRDHCRFFLRFSLLAMSFFATRIDVFAPRGGELFGVGRGGFLMGGEIFVEMRGGYIGRYKSNMASRFLVLVILNQALNFLAKY